MIVPGSNLLATALTVISGQTVGYVRYKGRSVNDAGDDIVEYDKPKPKRGSFQAVEKKYYEALGLDFEREYAMWYDPTGEINGVDRDRGADLIYYGGATWEAVQTTDWKPQDGWRGSLFVNIKRPAGCCK